MTTLAAQWETAARAFPGLIARLDGRAACALAFGLGALASFAQAPWHVFPAFMIGLFGLVWLVDAANARTVRRGWATFGCGWWWGFGYFLTGMHWIAQPFLQVEGGWVLMVPATLALPAGLALFWGAATRLAASLWTDDWRRIAALALSLGVLEFARSTLFTGLPWNLPAHIWPAGGPISQLAAHTGVFGLSALTVLVLAAPATLWDHKARGEVRRAAPTMIALLAFGIAWGTGATRLAQAPEGPEGPVVRVVDAGLTQAERWSDEGLDITFQRLLDRTGAPRESRAEIVVWPESALPGVPLLEPSYEGARAVIGETLATRVLITGLIRRDDTGNDPTYYNSAAVFDAVDGSLRLGQVYDKRHLVPFGEYLPFWELYSDVPLAPLQNIGRGFTPGERTMRMIVPGAPPVAPMICYEGIFSGFPPRGEERAGWLVNVSVDSWFGTGAGPRQHLNLVRYRAIEEGLPLARAAAGGVSGIYDSFGREIVATDLTGGAVEAPLPPSISPPIYAQLGKVLTIVLFVFIALIRFAPFGAYRRLKS